MLISLHIGVVKPAFDIVVARGLEPVDDVLLRTGDVRKISSNRPAGRCGFDACHAQRRRARPGKGQPVDIMAAVFGILAGNGCRIKADVIGIIEAVIAVLVKDFDGDLLTQVIDAQGT